MKKYYIWLAVGSLVFGIVVASIHLRILSEKMNAEVVTRAQTERVTHIVPQTNVHLTAEAVSNRSVYVDELDKEVLALTSFNLLLEKVEIEIAEIPNRPLRIALVELWTECKDEKRTEATNTMEKTWRIMRAIQRTECFFAVMAYTKSSTHVERARTVILHVYGSAVERLQEQKPEEVDRADFDKICELIRGWQDELRKGSVKA